MRGIYSYEITVNYGQHTEAWAKSSCRKFLPKCISFKIKKMLFISKLKLFLWYTRETSSLVKVVARCQKGETSLPWPTETQLTDAHMRRQTSISYCWKFHCTSMIIMCIMCIILYWPFDAPVYVHDYTCNLIWKTIRLLHLDPRCRKG